MRIGYLSESMRWSGGAQQLVWMAQALTERGHQVTLIIQEGSDLVEAGRKAGLPMTFLKMRQDYDVPAAWRVAKKVREWGLEVLHAQHAKAHAIGLMAAGLSKVPVFCVTRRVIFPIRRNLFSKLKYLSGRIDGYVAISEAVREELLKAHVPAERIDVIPSVVKPPALNAADGAAVGTGECYDVPADLIITCIGYRTPPIPDVPYDEKRGRFANEEGRIMPGLYCVGWARRGPTGTIGTNKPDGFLVAEAIAADQPVSAEKPGREGLDALIAARGLDIVTFRDWQKIDLAEIERARSGAPREKFVRVDDMVAASRG